MYYCEHCDKKFDDDEVIVEHYCGSYEDYYGVSNLFSNKRHLEFDEITCPCCGNILDEDDWFDEDDYTDEDN